MVKSSYSTVGILLENSTTGECNGELSLLCFILDEEQRYSFWNREFLVREGILTGKEARCVLEKFLEVGLIKPLSDKPLRNPVTKKNFKTKYYQVNSVSPVFKAFESVCSRMPKLI